MARRRGLRRRTNFISEMFGKDTARRGFGSIRTIWSGLFGHKTTIDYSRNNYELFRVMYYASGARDSGIDETMLLGAGFAKPIINSTVAFAFGQGLSVQLAGADGNEALKAAETDLQEWIDRNYDKIYDWAKYGTRDGDAYLFLDEIGNISQLKPDTVDVVVDAVTGEVIGYNVTDHVKETDPLTGQETKSTYLKQYRRNLIRITKMKDGESQKEGTIIYERIFANGAAIDTQLEENSDLQLLEDEIDTRALPIVHFKNEPEPGAVYGNSELQNVLVFMRNYGEVLDEATKANVYNSKPVLVLTGVGSPEDDEANKDAYIDDPSTGEKVLDWQQRTTLYIEDPQGDAKFLEVPNTMDNTGKLLEYLFYCIVQSSETPEFVFGTAVSSSRASVSEQMPIVAMKAERKRMQARGPFLDLINLYIERQLDLSNPIYFALQDAEPVIDITYPAIISDDRKLNAEIVSTLLEQGIITSPKSLEILLDMSADEAREEVAAALKDATARLEAAGGNGAGTDRLNAELNSSQE